MAEKKVRTVPMETFLDMYKWMEQMIREAYGSDTTVLDYENTLPVEEQGRMAMCRRIRNYAQHNPDSGSFLAITETMFQFIKGQGSKAACARNTAGKIARKAKALTEADGTKEICAWMLKYGTDFAPVVDRLGKFIGYVDNDMLKEMVYKITGVSTKEETSIGRMWKNKLPSELHTTDGDMVADDYMIADDEMVHFLNNGGTCVVVRNPDCKYIGIVSRKAGNW